MINKKTTTEIMGYKFRTEWQWKYWLNFKIYNMHLKQNLERNLPSKMFLFKMKRLKIKKLVENKRLIIRKLENY